MYVREKRSNIFLQGIPWVSDKIARVSSSSTDFGPSDNNIIIIHMVVVTSIEQISCSAML